MLRVSTDKRKGRHNIWVDLRVVTIDEAMAAIIIMDHYLRFKAYI